MLCTNSVQHHIMVTTPNGRYRRCLACGMVQLNQELGYEAMLANINELRAGIIRPDVSITRSDN